MVYLFPLGLLLILLGLSGGSWHLWLTSTPAIIPAGRYLYAPGAIIAFLGILIRYRTHSGKTHPLTSTFAELREHTAHPFIWATGLIFLFVSDWPDRPFGFIPVQWFRGEIILGSLVAAFLLFRRRSNNHGSIPWAAPTLLLTLALCIWCFYNESRGRLLFSDDHAMFLFRLHLLKENFPIIPFWSPLWNAGFDARDFFATGALAPFLVSAPLVYFFDVTRSYNSIVAYLLWVLVPTCAYLAARLLSASRSVACITALLSVTSSLFWYRWTLKYGTMGFTVASALAPLVVALGWRFITRPSISRFEATAGVIAVSIMLMWTPSGLAIVPPLIALGIPYTLSVLRSRVKILAILAILAINIPMVLTLWKVSAVSKFLDLHKNSPSQVSVGVQGNGQPQPTPVPTPVPDIKAPHTAPGTDDATVHLQGRTFRHKASGFNLKKSMKGWQEFAVGVNPLLLLCGIPALLALAAPYRLFATILVGWLTFLGTIAVPLFPQLELDRMLVLLSVALTYPVAHYLVGLFQRAQNFPALGGKLPVSVLGGFLLASPFATSSVIMNRTSEHYYFATPAVQNMVELAKRETHGGRMLFTGCVVHDLSGGHLAPLASWSHIPMVASSFAHNLWWYTQIIPTSFLRRGDEGIKDYFNYMNSTVVLAHEPYWRDYFLARPAEYQEVWRGDTFIAFKRLNYTSQYSLEPGVALTEMTTNSVTFTTTTPTAVLKFKHFPFLVSDSCKVEKYVVAPELDLIKVTDCPINTPITLRSTPPRNRILGLQW